MVRNVRTMSRWLAVAALALVTLVVPTLGLAPAAPVAHGSSSPQQWAYGAQRWVNASVTMPNGTYTVSAYFGWHVIFTATNTSATTIELEAARTMGAHFFAQFCSPNCNTSGGNRATIHMMSFERDAGFVNLTATATVTEHGATTAAIGIANAAAHAQSGVNESFAFSGMHGGVARSGSASLAASAHANASIVFSTALGLVPWNAVPGSTWNSSAPFTAQGAWGFSWNAQRNLGIGGSFNSSGSPSGSVNGSGTIGVYGRDIGNVTLRNNQTVPEVVLQVTGPFDDEDGVILVPHDFDMFGGGPVAFGAASIAGQSAATSKVDFALDAGHHGIRVAAAATVFSADGTSLGLAAQPAGPAPMAAASPTGPSELQAQPESVPQAQQGSQCLISTCPSGGSVAGHGLVGSILPLLLIGLVAVAVVGTVTVAEYRIRARRRAERLRLGSMGVTSTTGPVPPGAPALGMVPPPPAPPASADPPGEPPRLW